MKTLISRLSPALVLAIPLVVTPAPSLQAEEVAVGASRAEVMDRLGDPSGRVKVGKSEYLQYTRGMVELKDGVVVSSTVVSKAVYEKRLAEQQAQAEAARQRAEARRRELIRRGTEEKEKVLAYGTVAARSPADQVAYWRQFTRTYPGVDVSAELAAAQENLAAVRKKQQAAEAKRKQELAEAEANKGPPAGMSSRQLRKWKRGRGQTE